MTYLDALTDPTGITITYVNQFENEIITDPNSVGINWSSISWSEEARVEDTEHNQFTFQIVGSSLTNAMTILDHMRDSMKAKTLAGGHYHCATANPIKEGGYYLFYLDVEEVLYTQ